MFSKLKIILTLFTFSACAHYHSVGTQSTDLEIAKINAQLAGKRAYVKLRSGEKFWAKNVQFNGEYNFSKKDTLASERIEKVESIQIKNYKRGAWEALKYGFISGASAGGILGIAIYATYIPQPQYLIGMPLMFGGIWSFLGLSAGGINGADEIIHIAHIK
ncbi:MAG: hypothetical protein DWQ05_05455 [Calditrichaeota bacterium]|nr:MAG: hypothetical protein DWQ05_05455 [Calditrichota bacterium]